MRRTCGTCRACCRSNPLRAAAISWSSTRTTASARGSSCSARNRSRPCRSAWTAQSMPSWPMATPAPVHRTFAPPERISMLDLYLAELRRFRFGAAVFALAHLVILAELQQRLELTSAGIEVHMLMLIVYALTGLGFAVLQFGSYRRDRKSVV